MKCSPEILSVFMKQNTNLHSSVADPGGVEGARPPFQSLKPLVIWLFVPVHAPLQSPPPQDLFLLE